MLQVAQLKSRITAGCRPLVPALGAEAGGSVIQDKLWLHEALSQSQYYITSKQTKRLGSWRDDSIVKSTCCCSREPEFISQ